MIGGDLAGALIRNPQAICDGMGSRAIWLILFAGKNQLASPLVKVDVSYLKHDDQDPDLNQMRKAAQEGLKSVVPEGCKACVDKVQARPARLLTLGIKGQESRAKSHEQHRHGAPQAQIM